MSEEIKSRLHTFFPAQNFSDESVAKDLENGDILVAKEDILPFLQTALLDEKVIEFEIDGAPRVYFSRLKDDIPEEYEDSQEGDDLDAIYNDGDYLLEMSHIVSLPLEPGLGNLHLRHSRTVVLRMFTNAYAVEFGSTFLKLEKIKGVPVIQLEYPEIARIVRDARECRVKVPESMNFSVSVDLGDDEQLVVSATDISIKGMGLSLSRDEKEFFTIDDSISFKVFVDDELLANLNASVRHLSQIRKKSGIEHICGVLFDLESRTTAAVVESIVATVQRAHLKDLEKKSDASGIDLIP
jgi:c-di-GMP-binding flagellar brake protein YcgR